MRLQHAEHNEKLCKHLMHINSFPDWVVTTAFYSALHFIEHKLFPLGVGDKSYSTFNQYYLSEVQNTDNEKSKHEAKIDLVHNHLNAAHPHYRQLFDLCMTARYRNYKVDPLEAKMAQQRLEIIKTYCTQ